MNAQEPRRIRIFDTTLRDGEQSPGASMNLEEKLKIAEVLEKIVPPDATSHGKRHSHAG